MEPYSLVGTYRFESAENLDEYLKSLGVGLVLRKVLSVSRPNCVISYRRAADQWTVTFDSVFKTRERVFRPQVRFEDETFDTRKCQTSVDVDETRNTMTWHQICEEGPNVEMIISATEDGGLRVIMKAAEFSCEQNFKGLRDGDQLQEQLQLEEVNGADEEG